jgi:hypothetical protein
LKGNTMRYFIALVSLVLLSMACSRPKVEPTRQQQVAEFQHEQAALDGPVIPVTTTTTRNAPKWIDNADRDGHLTAVGIAAKPLTGDKSFQREMAVNRGIAALGKKLSTTTDQLFLQLQTQTVQGRTDMKKPTQAELVEVNNTIRNLTSAKIKGARVPYFWIDSADGTLYCLVQLDDNSSFEVLREATINQPALHEAVIRLDNELAKK